jgi:hypothetical protein
MAIEMRRTIMVRDFAVRNTSQRNARWWCRGSSQYSVAAVSRYRICTAFRSTTLGESRIFAYLSWPWRRAIVVVARVGSRDVDA